MTNSVQNSFNTSTYKPPRIITEDDEVVCISEQSSEDHPYIQYGQVKNDLCRETDREQ